MICDTSRAVRDAMAATIAITERQRTHAARERRAADEIHVEDTKEARALASAARSAARAVHRHTETSQHDDTGCAMRCLRAAVASKHRTLVAMDDVIAEAAAKGWITPHHDRFQAGESRPA
ncbi:MAG: hypothetical protein U5R31_03110 [Acidimicrobiia bacterium]|nr:hypothetical protein [Acidimicrobiia bacterium]